MLLISIYYHDFHNCMNAQKSDCDIASLHHISICDQTFLNYMQ